MKESKTFLLNPMTTFFDNDFGWVTLNLPSGFIPRKKAKSMAGLFIKFIGVATQNLILISDFLLVGMTLTMAGIEIHASSLVD